MMSMLGSHVEPDDPITGAVARSAGIAQIFLGDPQSWRAPQTLWPGGAADLAMRSEEAGTGLYVHAPYVINVASTNNRIRIPSRKLLKQTLTAAAEIGARGVIVHGGHVTAGDDVAVGFDNWRKAVDGADPEVPLLVENTAGGTHAMARYLENLERLWAAVQTSRNADRVGFCLDTCHAHAAGVELDGVVDRVLAITGRIDLVHVNDSRDALGSGADRHANLGQGQIPSHLLLEVVAAAAAPALVETPGGIAEQAADLAWLREGLANL